MMTATEPVSAGAGVLSDAEQEELRAQLAELDREMETLRAVLQSKQEKAQELRRKLGISPLSELKSDLEQSFKNIQDTQAYQKTSDVVKVAGEKTSQLFGSIGRKLGEMKNSPTYRSIEERMGSAYTNVRTSISSRSGSLYSFGDASVPQTPATEEKPIAVAEDANGHK
ncbi:tumor protein D52-like isoform X2 [Varroa jacobsoni]|uniref:Tumor protein D54 n=1 Tax=Varroa destructor TaxID=109461 RepID=A0A7M7JHN3_VARDE|nr:tumor protein D52-like isoform X2 [Varroa destructor]XP_022694913.1 tumor protein D52-like isoform X2 [Varroa jacobsoni]